MLSYWKAIFSRRISSVLFADTPPERAKFSGGYFLRGDLHKKNGKKDDIVRLSNYPHPPGLIVTAERVTNHIN